MQSFRNQLTRRSPSLFNPTNSTRAFSQTTFHCQSLEHGATIYMVTKHPKKEELRRAEKRNPNLDRSIQTNRGAFGPLIPTRATMTGIYMNLTRGGENSDYEHDLELITLYPLDLIIGKRQVKALPRYFDWKSRLRGEAPRTAIFLHHLLYDSGFKYKTMYRDDERLREGVFVKDRQSPIRAIIETDAIPGFNFAALQSEFYIPGSKTAAAKEVTINTGLVTSLHP